MIATKRRDIMCDMHAEITEEGRKLVLALIVNKTKTMQIRKSLDRNEII